MLRGHFVLLVASSLSLITGGYVSADATGVNVHTVPVNSTCNQIAKSISQASEVFRPSDLLGNYTEDISHYALSSSDTAACSVEPGTAKDVGIILQILGKNKTPFAVKGGGHAMNPGFSSTKGVQISMSRFSEVTYNETSQTAVVGSGLIWDDVYAALAPYNVGVVGGRVTGVGVAGFTLGGGYSWLTNQHGLTLDNVEAYELVLPNGLLTSVTQTSNPDLFFALRGGFNNFGIVTRFTFKTYPQGQVWGGFITILGDHLDEVSAATVKFQDLTDPKAQIIPSYGFAVGMLTCSLLIFYDGPTPPAGIFDELLAIPAILTDLSTRSFLSLVQSSPVNETDGARGAYHTVPVESYSLTLLDAIVNETLFWGPRLSSANASIVAYAIEPFLPTILSHGSGSAYPPIRSKRFLPTNLYFAWPLANTDDIFQDAIRASVQQLLRVAENDGQHIEDASFYGNYAIFDTPVESIYGGNLDRLRWIKRQYDPANVMGLAGGWKITL